MAEKKSASQATTQTFEESDFTSLLQQEFKPKTDQSKQAIQNAVRTLAEQALAGAKVIPGRVIETIEGMIAAIDKKLSEQINAIMHHADFQ